MADAPAADAQGYVALVAELKHRIADARLRAALSVNRELVSLYWEIGGDILSREGSEGCSAKVIDRLAADLGCAFPEMTGLSCHAVEVVGRTLRMVGSGEDEALHRRRDWVRWAIAGGWASSCHCCLVVGRSHDGRRALVLV